MTVKTNLISKIDYFQYFGEKPEQHDSYKSSIVYFPFLDVHYRYEKLVQFNTTYLVL